MAEEEERQPQGPDPVDDGDNACEQEEEEDLDNALEEELAASIHRHRCCLPLNPSTSRTPPPSLQPEPSSLQSGSSLTFSFPGWGLEISRDVKRRRPSIVRHHHNYVYPRSVDDTSGSSKEACQTADENPWGDADKPGDGNSVYKMPDDVLTNVFKRLGVKDLCSVIQTCHWWQHLGSQDNLWERFFDTKSPLKPLPISLPKWGIVKNVALSAQLERRVACKYAYFWKGFDHLRLALCTWWETRRPADPYTSKAIGGLVHKMTSHDWTLVYEFFGIVFTERADCLAAMLTEEIEHEAERNFLTLCPFRCDNHTHTVEVEEEQSSQGFPMLLNRVVATPTKNNTSFVEGMIGRNIWQRVCSLWKRYKNWLILVFEHCPELNLEVMVEKARATAWTTTPNIFEKGILSFRSQVLLRYGLRKVLQSGFSLLLDRDANGLTSDLEMELLQSIYHLLQEVDVRDDTLSPKTHTQTKLWRCFPTKRSSANRHMPVEMQKKLLVCN